MKRAKNTKCDQSKKKLFKALGEIGDKKSIFTIKEALLDGMMKV